MLNLPTTIELVRTFHCFISMGYCSTTFIPCTLRQVYFPAVQAFLRSRHEQFYAQWLDLVPRCYFAASMTVGAYDACIAMEDLRVGGYRALRLADGASGQDCARILSKLAFLHAVSACFLRQHPDFIQNSLRFSTLVSFSWLALIWQPLRRVESRLHPANDSCWRQ